MSDRTSRLRIGIICAMMLGTSSADAQFGSFGDALQKLAAPSLGKLMSGPAPVSTSIRDAVYGDPTRDGASPRERPLPLETLHRTPDGGFVLAAGYYQMSDQSYCLHAGTFGPGGGDGYLYGPLVGSARDAVTSILRNSVAHPDINQHDVQLLLWAIVARAKFEDLNSELKYVAARLLTPRQIASLNRSALGMLTGPELSRFMGNAPPFVRQVMEAEAQMRNLLSSSSLNYAELERLAVLTGAAPRGDGSVDTPSGRWSRHPDGYLIRYIPSGYSQTLTQIWVEPGSPGIGIVYDPALGVAVPTNTSRQRLAQSGRRYGS
ncbi:hypothetical protein [Sphingomonas bacterium]|uniref:hypothetical protein n=1 Tax=Sphingomonas bacterium TaxID=1895847 RepID=UPI00157738C8|nr:hypothetical protein [Sphingomonas bacterium]